MIEREVCKKCNDEGEIEVVVHRSGLRMSYIDYVTCEDCCEHALYEDGYCLDCNMEEDLCR